MKGVGALVAAIGVGQIIAGYLYPNTSEEITNAVDAFEKISPQNEILYKNKLIHSCNYYWLFKLLCFFCEMGYTMGN